MRIRGVGEQSQKAHIWAIKDVAAFQKRAPDTATPDDLRAYQPHVTDAGVTPSTFNARILGFSISGTLAAPLARRFPPTFRHELRARGE